jgi:hypothetical protein
MPSMASRLRSGRRDGLGLALFVGQQHAIDHVREAPPQQPQRLGAGLAASQQPLDVRLAGPHAAGLGDGDHVQRPVDGAVATAVEPHPHAVARPHRDRRGPVETGEGVPGAEPAGADGLPQDGRRGKHPAARDRHQPWRQHPHQVAQITLELVDPHGQLPAADQQLPGDLGHRAVDTDQPGGQLVDHLVAAQPTRGHVQLGVELVQCQRSRLQSVVRSTTRSAR